MLALVKKSILAYDKVGNFLTKYLEPLWLMGLRAYLATVFFKSGLQKLQDFDGTVYLFTEYYFLDFETGENVIPFAPTSLELMAYLGTAFELLLPIALILGLLTRLAALPLLSMALVIQYVMGAIHPDDFYTYEHFIWIAGFSYLIIRGPGWLSIDHWLAVWAKKSAPAKEADEKASD